MSDSGKGKSGTTELRQRAEDMLRLADDGASSDPSATLTLDEAHRLLHEMRVHKVELEIQNEELRETHTDMEASRARYFELYDLAPVGYLTLDNTGVIQEANLTCATLLGVSRNDLPRKPLTRFILREDQDVYYLHRKQLFKTGMPQVCELRILRKDNARFWARVESSVVDSDSDNTPQCRCIISDISDQKRADINERRLESIYRAAPIGIGMLRHRVFMDVNDSMCRMTGYSRFELIGKNARILYPSQEDYDYVGKEKYSQIETHGIGSVETRWRRKTGEIRHILLSSSPMDSRDLAQGVTFTALDITDRKKAESALREQVRFEKMVAGLASCLINIPFGKIDETINDALRTMGEFFDADRCYVFKFHSEQPRFDVTHEWCREDVGAQVNSLQDIAMENFPWAFEQLSQNNFLHVPDVAALPPEATAEKAEFQREGIQSLLNIPFRKDGKIAYTLGFDHCREKKTWADAQIELIKVVGDVLADAFEKSALETALGNNMDELLRAVALNEALFDAVPDILGVQDANHSVLRYNRAGYASLKMTPQQVHGKKCYELLGRHTPCEQCATALAVQSGKPARIERFVEELNVWLDVRAYPILDDSGAVTLVIEHLRDITEEKNREKERRKLESQIEQTQRLESLGIMAGGIAHDFNNILMAVLGHAEMALDEVPPASSAYENIKHVNTAALRAAELCREMLAYAGKASFAVESVNVKELIEEMARLLQSSISKNVTLRMNLKSELPCIETDPSQIRQVVMNLILNAAEAIGDKAGTVTVSTDVRHCTEEDFLAMESLEDLTPGLYVSLDVSDTGEGMDADTKSRIFEPFFTTKFTGRGLGLAAVLGIVRSARGMIKVYSEPGQGTRFSILLPAQQNDSDITQPDRDSGNAASDAWQGKGVVLLADDEKPLRLLGTLMFRRLGFEVIAVKDGKEAVKAYRERNGEVDLVFLDLTMPHMSGMDAYEALLELDPNARVVMVSGYSEEDMLARIGKKRVAGIIQKPYTFDCLRDIVRAVMPSECPE